MYSPKLHCQVNGKKTLTKCSFLKVQPIKRVGFYENPENHSKDMCHPNMSFYYAMPHVNAKLSQRTGIKSLYFQMPTSTTFVSRGFKRGEASLANSKTNLYQNMQRSITCYFSFSITNSLKSLCTKLCQMLTGSDC